MFFGDRTYLVTLSRSRHPKKAIVRSGDHFIQFKVKDDILVVRRMRIATDEPGRRNIDEEALIEAFRKQLLLVMRRCPR